MAFDDPTSAGPAHRHFYAVINGPEQARAVSSAFVTAGLGLSERVILVGLADRQAGSLVNRLRADGADPDGALRGGRLIIADRSVTSALYLMTPQQFADRIIERARSAIRDGFTGIRLGGLRPGITTSPHEGILSELVRRHPVTALCLYHHRASAEVLCEVEEVHDRRVSPATGFDDPPPPITTCVGHTLRPGGRGNPGNRGRLPSLPTDATAEGRLVIDGHPLADTLARNGFPVPGQTTAAVVTNLTWRTFGPRRATSAESVLDWAGLWGSPAGTITEVAHRHHSAPGTLTNRIRQVTSRGAETPLSPVQLRDATRATQSTEDHLSRSRTAQLLELPPPRRQ